MVRASGGRCSACGAEILWVETPKCADMPVDIGLVRVWPVRGGPLVVVDLDGRVRADDREPAADLFGWVPEPIEARRPHWSTGPHAERFRRDRDRA